MILQTFLADRKLWGKLVFCKMRMATRKPLHKDKGIMFKKECLRKRPCHWTGEILHGIPLASYLCQPWWLWTSKIHALCGNTMRAAISVPAVTPQHLGYALLSVFIMSERIEPWNCWSLAALPTPFPLILWVWRDRFQVTIPIWGSSSQKLCSSDEESQLVSYNCILGKMGNKATCSPYTGSHKSQTSFFPHSSQNLDLEGKSIHPINKVC